MEIASTCLANLEIGRLADWIKALELFNAFMSMLCARYEFDLERILDFQGCVDNFMDLWHKLTGGDVIGNYFYLLDVGHIADQLLMHGFFYRYSQQ